MAWAETHRDKFRGGYRDPEGKRVRTKSFSTKRAAVQAARDQEARVRNGTWFDPAAGRVTMRSYVEEQWLPNRGGEFTTRENCRSSWNQIKDRWAEVEIRKIMPSSVQGWITEMTDAGVSPSTIRHRFVFLQTVLAAKKGASAMRDGLVERNPCHGAILPHVPESEVEIYEPAEVDALLDALDPYWRMLALFAVETGLRWSEVMGSRVSDFELDFKALTVRETVVEVTTARSGTGTPFVWKAYPKGRRSRRVVMTPDSREAVRQLVAERGLGREDRLFSMPAVLPCSRRVQVILTPDLLAELGTFVAPNGRTYQHGTINGAQTGKCKCQGCKQASSDYRYTRLYPEGPLPIDPAPKRTAAWPEGLPIGRTFFRESVWLPAIAEAEVPQRTFHDLRATHISWLLSQSVDLPTVMERVGHREFETTRRYTATLSDADDKVLNAMAGLRRAR
jgi:integrase